MAKTNEYLDEAYHTLVNLSADEQKRLEYEAREKAVRDYNEMMMESRESGLELGLERGRTEGRRQGAVDIAKKLLASGVDEKIIAESTGLSLAQIEELKE